MARIPITVMGCKCEKCSHEWIPRDHNGDPAACPKCKSTYWNRPKNPMTTYEDFRDAIRRTLEEVKGGPLTWTEIRTVAGLPQKFPNNKWVRQIEKDIGLTRKRDAHGIIQWKLS